MDDMIALVKPLIPALRRYARALLRNPTAADDLVQDCLERAIKAWHQRRKDGLPKVIHNLGPHPTEDDDLDAWTILGHFRPID